MREPELIKEYLKLESRFNACGIAIRLERNHYQIDAPEANGIIYLYNLRELECFIRGYELGKARASEDN